MPHLPRERSCRALLVPSWDIADDIRNAETLSLANFLFRQRDVANAGLSFPADIAALWLIEGLAPALWLMAIFQVCEHPRPNIFVEFFHALEPTLAFPNGSSSLS